MTEIKLTSALPKGESINGLTTLASNLTSEPEQMHVAVIVFDCSKITIDTDTGEAIPTARIRRIEPITRPEDKKRLNSLTRRAFEERTGKAVLPLELEDELRSAFGGDDA